jgi:DNA-binding MarR family transcriptional regulator
MPRKRTILKSDHAKDIARSWARERPDLEPTDYLLHIYLIRIGRILERAADQRSKGLFGVSIAEVRVLLALRRAGDGHSRRPTDLFRALLVSSGAITKTVDRLISLGMVKRLTDPSDKGGFLIHLTAKGKSLADNYMTELASSASTLSRDRLSLSRTERKMTVRLCERILLDLDNSDRLSEESLTIPAVEAARLAVSRKR